VLSLATTLHDQQATRRDLPWAIGHAAAIKKEKAENQGAGQKLKTVCKEENVIYRKLKLY